jgi:hypothetical protein
LHLTTITMTLSDITTDKTLFDIHSPTLVDDMSVVIPELATFTTEIPLIDICRYLILMYDIGSPMRDNVRMYYERKHKCAEILNFPTSKIGWEARVENMLIGKDQLFNALIASYIAQMGLPEYTQLIAYLEIQKIKYMEIFSGKMSDKSDQIIDRVTIAIVEITRKLFGSGQEDEITMARKALYQRSAIDKSRYIPTPETMVKLMESEGKLPEDCNPYPDDYEVEASHFLGDTDPRK